MSGNKNQNDFIALLKTSMFICMQKINFIIHFFLTILHFKESCNLIDRQHFGPWLETQNYARAPEMLVKYQKISKTLFWALLPKFGPKMNFPGKGALPVFQYSNYLPLCQKSEKPNEPFLRKLSEGHTKNQFISLISLWDTASFGVLRLIEKSCNLVSQEHFGPYLKYQSFPKYEICWNRQELQ